MNEKNKITRDMVSYILQYDRSTLFHSLLNWLQLYPKRRYDDDDYSHSDTDNSEYGSSPPPFIGGPSSFFGYFIIIYLRPSLGNIVPFSLPSLPHSTPLFILSSSLLSLLLSLVPRLPQNRLQCALVSFCSYVLAGLGKGFGRCYIYTRESGSWSCYVHVTW